MWPFGHRVKPTLGQLGEKLAVGLLKGKGLKILARNYRCPAGEADLIALDTTTRPASGAETIVFVEVKARSSDRYVDPESAVDDDKRRRMRRVADCYLATRGSEGYNVRFDIVSVVLGGDQKPKMRHTPDAF